VPELAVLPVSSLAPTSLKVLEAHLKTLTWESGIKVARDTSGTGPGTGMNTVDGPHWKDKENVAEEKNEQIQHYASGSQKPGVYLFKGKGAETFMVELEITENIGVSGSFKLRGTLAGLKMESESVVPLGKGTHKVAMKFINLPTDLRHYEDDVSDWRLEEEAGAKASGLSFKIPETSRLEVFVIYDKPAAFYKEGVWVEALRLVFKKAKVAGLDRPEKISARVTEYCHSEHGMRYDTVAGYPFFVSGSDGGEFALMQYIKKQSSEVAVCMAFPGYCGRDNRSISSLTPNTVNCYDQAAAVQAFCGCLGVDVQWIYQKPFGYIKTTDLVGVGKCNNPFFDRPSNPNTPEVSGYGYRSGFGNHAFVAAVPQEYIRDACAEPHVGTEDLRAYLGASIDFEYHEFLSLARFGPVQNSALPTAAYENEQLIGLMKETSMEKGIEKVK
jgi:hypothetical protein